MKKLRSGTDILIATPGRLLDLYQQNAIKFEQLDTLVLDEADRMLDMGFIHDIKRILALLPKKRQNLLFSATFSNDIRELAKNIVRDPLEIKVTPPNTVVERIEQCLYQVAKSDKNRLLVNVIKQQDAEQILVFSRTKHGANKLVKRLARDSISAVAIHGNRSQNQRTQALGGFKAGKFPVTVDASGSGDGLRCAINSTAFDGTCTSPSVYLEDQALPMMSMYSRCCTLHAGRAHARAAIPSALELVQVGFDPAIVTTETIHFDDAEEALRTPSMKPVLIR